MELQSNFDNMQSELMKLHREASDSKFDVKVAKKFREITVRAQNTEGSVPIRCLLISFTI